jgi:hypothetical protein
MGAMEILIGAKPSKGKPDGDEPTGKDGEEEESSTDAALETAVSNLMDAIKSGDTAAATKAFKVAASACY